jgi:hypothetical protein
VTRAHKIAPSKLGQNPRQIAFLGNKSLQWQNDDDDHDLEMRAKERLEIIGGSFPGSRFDPAATVRLTGGRQPCRQNFCPRISRWRKLPFAASLPPVTKLSFGSELPPKPPFALNSAVHGLFCFMSVDESDINFRLAGSMVEQNYTRKIRVKPLTNRILR